MKFNELKLHGAYLISLEKKEDQRGFFARFFCKDEFAKKNLVINYPQMNISFNKVKGTLRGLHYQKHPFGETKLVTCIRGKIFDVIVDLRKQSSSYGKVYCIELSEKNKNIIYIPQGFAHGFQTLVDNTEVFYLHSKKHKPLSEDGINYKDPLLSINWPLKITNISERDLNLKSFQSRD